jgi:hypothetical protein
MVRLLPCSAGLSKKRSTGRSPARTVALEFDEPAIASRQVQNKHGTILEKSTMNACRSERSRREIEHNLPIGDARRDMATRAIRCVSRSRRRLGSLVLHAGEAPERQLATLVKPGGRRRARPYRP